ncbi:MAG: hypothetical protein IPL79_04770 [Myxococcales bacterium]|nr:hypothetical protein [Myxococcales bacterium]
MHPPLEPSCRAHQVLRQSWASGALHHAHLLTGNLTAALGVSMALAADFNCDAGGPAGLGQAPVACGTCAACERIGHGVHPDVITVAGEGAAGAIPIETVRAISASMAMPPHEARVRVFVIADAGALLGAAANALLKTLEEPPARTIFMLCARSQQSVMPTIRSRCQRHVIIEQRRGVEETGVAARAQDEGFDAGLLAVLRSSGLCGISDFVAQHGGERGAERAAAISLIDAILRTASAQSRKVLQAGRANANRVAHAWALCGQQALAAGRALTSHNAAPTLTLESLLLQMRTTGELHDGFRST